MVDHAEALHYLWKLQLVRVLPDLDQRVQPSPHIEVPGADFATVHEDRFGNQHAPAMAMDCLRVDEVEEVAAG